jgi:hypothetical protein
MSFHEAIAQTDNPNNAMHKPYVSDVCGAGATISAIAAPVTSNWMPIAVRPSERLRAGVSTTRRSVVDGPRSPERLRNSSIVIHMGDQRSTGDRCAYLSVDSSSQL